MPSHGVDRRARGGGKAARPRPRRGASDADGALYEPVGGATLCASAPAISNLPRYVELSRYLEI